MIPRAARNERPPVRRMWVAFESQGRRWVLPAGDVDSVSEPTSITPLPTADHRRLGVFLHRGRVVAVISVDGRTDRQQLTHCVVLKDEGFAIPVDRLLGLEMRLDDEIPEGFELFDRASVGGLPMAPARAPMAAEAS